MSKRLSDAQFRDRVLGSSPPPNSERAYAMGVIDGEKNVAAVRSEVELANDGRRAALDDKRHLMEALEMRLTADIHLDAHCYRVGYPSSVRVSLSLLDVSNLFSGSVSMRLGDSGVFIEGGILRLMLEAPTTGKAP